MLAKRIIPCLDVNADRVVKGVNFVELRDAGDPVEIARRYDEQGADEITFLDITARSDDRPSAAPQWSLANTADAGPCRSAQRVGSATQSCTSPISASMVVTVGPGLPSWA